MQDVNTAEDLGCDQTCLNEAFGTGYASQPSRIFERILTSQCCEAFTIVSIDNVEFGEYSYGRRSEPAEEYGDYDGVPAEEYGDYAGDYADEPAEADGYGYGPAEESVDYGEYDQSIAPTD